MKYISIFILFSVLFSCDNETYHKISENETAFPDCKIRTMTTYSNYKDSVYYDSTVYNLEYNEFGQLIEKTWDDVVAIYTYENNILNKIVYYKNNVESRWININENYHIIEYGFGGPPDDVSIHIQFGKDTIYNKELMTITTIPFFSGVTKYWKIEKLKLMFNEESSIELFQDIKYNSYNGFCIYEDTPNPFYGMHFEFEYYKMWKYFSKRNLKMSFESDAKWKYYFYKYDKSGYPSEIIEMIRGGRITTKTKLEYYCG